MEREPGSQRSFSPVYCVGWKSSSPPTGPSAVPSAPPVLPPTTWEVAVPPSPGGRRHRK